MSKDISRCSAMEEQHFLARAANEVLGYQIHRYGGLTNDITHPEKVISIELIRPAAFSSPSGSFSTFIEVARLLIEFGMPGVAAMFLLSARLPIMKWLEVRKDRSIEMKAGDISVTIKGSNDIDRAVAAFEKLNDGRVDDRKSDPVSE
jgi:hypothetical protein